MSAGERLLGGCLTREQWLLRETKIVAQLRSEGMADDEISALARRENIFQYPTERTLANIARVCCKRLRMLDSPRLETILLSGFPEAASQANLYAMMCTYPLMSHFMLEEVACRYLQLDYSLSSTDMNAYFTRLAAEYDNIASLSDSTIVKLKQVLCKCLAECGMLDVSERRLIPLFIDQDVRDAIVAKGDAPALAAFGWQEMM